MHIVAPLPPWAVRRSRMVHGFDAVDPARTALLVVDLQEAFLASGRSAAVRYGLPIIPNVNRLIGAARSGGAAVIFLRQSFDWSNGPRSLAPWQAAAAPEVQAVRRAMTPGHPGHALHSALDVRDGDVILDKYRQSAFAPHSSALETRLQAAGVDTVIITGAMTNACCEATARDAYGRGYRVFFISDATASLSDEEHNASLLNVAMCCGDVRNTDSMAALLDAGAASQA